MSDIYLFAIVKIPIQIYSDGTHNIFSDRISVDFDKCDPNKFPLNTTVPANEQIQKKIRKIILHQQNDKKKKNPDTKILWGTNKDPIISPNKCINSDISDISEDEYDNNGYDPDHRTDQTPLSPIVNEPIVNEPIINETNETNEPEIRIFKSDMLNKTYIPKEKQNTTFKKWPIKTRSTQKNRLV
jgi:hypothetical protein